MNSNWTNRADFVIVGAQHGEGVLVLASRTLTYAQLEHEFQYYTSLSDPFSAYYLPMDHITLEIEMSTYTVVKAPTYQEAFTKLFRTWNPEQPNNQRQEIEVGQKGIEQ